MMNRILFTSDLHFNHDREFIWKARGFTDVADMNIHIIDHWNSVVKPEDEVYLLGDVMLGNNEIGLDCLSRLNGKIHLIRGNHDTDNRIEIFSNMPDKIVEICDAKYLRINGYHFYLTHYPCLTGNLHKESLKQMTLNLHGHTHSKDRFFYDLPFCYNVGVDAHDCYPVNVNEIIEDMKNKVMECKNFL